MLSLCFLCVFPADAALIVDLETGNQVKTESALSNGGTLIYIEKGCDACRKYLSMIPDCPEIVKSRIRYVSTSPVSQSKKMLREIPPGARLFVMRNPKDIRDVYATPTTVTALGKKVGPLSCASLRRLQEGEE